MLKDRKFEIGNFIRLASAGMEVAEFVDVRDAIIKRYKEVYGSDIDLSTASADGVFINDMALIINNILQIMKSLYSNLNVDTASGVYLDALCRLANVNRMSATKSTASIIVKSLLTTGDPVTFGDVDENGNVVNQITFVDKAGTEWVSDASVTLGPGENAEVKVTCTEAGPVDAPAGWINQTMLVMNLSVTQTADAIRGSNEETDTELRQRRAQSSGANGISVLESLVGALLEVTGIDDVSIYNNNTLENATAKDGTVIAPHNIYVVIRQQKGLNIDDSTICDLIYTKLTPGIKTTASAAVSENGIAKSYKFIPQMLGVTINYLNQFVYWKNAVAIKPTITAKIKPTQYFTENEINVIAQEVYNYANNIKLGDSIDADRIFIAILDADPEFKGQRTYTVSASDVSVTSTDNPDTYYEYSTVLFVKNDDNTYTLTIE
jgi:hypothetical protein